MTEADAIRDAHLARLEAALRKIATDPLMTIEHARRLSGQVTTTGVLASIPDGTSFRSREVAFTHWPAPRGRTWHLIGPADMLVPDTVIEVLRRGPGDRRGEDRAALVAVGPVVAERTVIHRGLGPTRYVITRISRAVKEDETTQEVRG